MLLGGQVLSVENNIVVSLKLKLAEDSKRGLGWLAQKLVRHLRRRVSSCCFRKTRDVSKQWTRSASRAAHGLKGVRVVSGGGCTHANSTLQMLRALASLRYRSEILQLL